VSLPSRMGAQILGPIQLNLKTRFDVIDRLVDIPAFIGVTFIDNTCMW